jgi:ribose-phosphate pyrophosphokinase
MTLTADLQRDSEFRAWLERIVEAKVKAALHGEREAHFRETFALISVRRSDPLAETIARLLDQRLVDVDLVTFGDGEKKPVIQENLSGKNVFVIATVGMDEDPDVSFANTCRLVSALRRTCKAGRITVVAPCLWYQAQDKTHARREPISVRDVADDITRRGMDHIMVVELHSEQIEIAFDSFDHLKVTPLFADYLSRRCREHGDRVVLISPDDGGVRTREELFKNMSAECVGGLASVHQVRVRGQVDAKEVLEFVGHVEDRVGVIFDDMLRSGMTMFQAAAEAKKRGAKRVVGAVAHFFGFGTRGKTFEEKLAESALDELIITNTRPDYFAKVVTTPELRAKITLLDISPYLAGAIRNYLTGGTVKDMIQRVPDRRELYRVLHAADAGAR